MWTNFEEPSYLFELPNSFPMDTYATFVVLKLESHGLPASTAVKARIQKKNIEPTWNEAAETPTLSIYKKKYNNYSKASKQVPDVHYLLILWFAWSGFGRRNRFAV